MNKEKKSILILGLSLIIVPPFFAFQIEEIYPGQGVYALMGVATGLILMFKLFEKSEEKNEQHNRQLEPN